MIYSVVKFEGLHFLLFHFLAGNNFDNLHPAKLVDIATSMD
jgi:hypothetical protein